LGAQFDLPQPPPVFAAYLKLFSNQRTSRASSETLMHRTFALIGFLTFCAVAMPATAMDCQGNANALGTSRILAVNAAQFPRVGTMQYTGTLPLGDREVVLTFDDGPLPPYTDRILAALRAECVRATFFSVGSMAKAYPNILRQAHREGHTIATHSNGHHMNVSAAYAQADYESGVAAVAAVLGDRSAVAPFYRFPGLGRSQAAEQYLAQRNVMAWSGDFDADDYKHISAEEIISRALTRLERKGRGILILHDIQPATARALPGLLRELKIRHFNIVHVVPAAPATTGRSAQ
jgi:peptidoglycan-N-acetylglucosamine deacetylase